MWKVYLHVKLPGVKKKKKKISPQNPFKANGYLVNIKIPCNTFTAQFLVLLNVYVGSINVNASVCALVCTCSCEGKQVWTFQRCRLRFSAGALGEKRAEGM